MTPAAGRIGVALVCALLAAVLALAACHSATPATRSMTVATRAAATTDATPPTQIGAPPTAPGDQPQAKPATAGAVALASDAPRVVAQGFSIDDAGGSYAVIVENPGAGVIGVRGDVRFYAADGEPALTRGFLIPYLAPHERTGWADVLPGHPVPTPASMEVELLPKPPGAADSDAIAIEVESGTTRTPPLATLLLINHNAEPVSGVRLSVVAYRTDGTIAGGGAKRTSELSPHLDTQIVVALPGLDQPARIEAYAAFTPESRVSGHPVAP